MSPAARWARDLDVVPLILAEELDANWDDVRIVPVPILEKVSATPPSAAP